MRTRGPFLVAVGGSCGAPGALAQILEMLDPEIADAVAFVVAQHTDARAIETFARWLAGISPLRVAVAEAGEAPRAGHLHLAGAGGDLVLGPNGRLRVEAPANPDGPTPSVDRLLESVAAHWRGPAMGVILSGMGADGARGLLAMRAAGHPTCVQDAESAVVDGMPAAARAAGGACQTLSPRRIAAALTRRAREIVAREESTRERPRPLR